MPSTYGEMRALIQRSWLACSVEPCDPGVDASSDPLVQSKVFQADGTFHNLGLDAQGGLVRINGVDNTGTYQLSDGKGPQPDGASLNSDTNLYMGIDGGQWNAGWASFETSPSRMKWEPDCYFAWWVAID
jgi:hypothetical protein